jgi:hypothetical protein
MDILSNLGARMADDDADGTFKILFQFDDDIVQVMAEGLIVGRAYDVRFDASGEGTEIAFVNPDTLKRFRIFTKRDGR